MVGCRAAAPGWPWVGSGDATARQPGAVELAVLVLQLVLIRLKLLV